MSENPNEVEVVDTPVEVTEAVNPKLDIIGDTEEIELNKKIASVIVSYFQALASLTADDIYKIAYTPEGKNSERLLELVSGAYNEMIAAGGNLPKAHFDSYKRIVDSFNQTLAVNLEAKLENNRDLLIALATGKTDNPERISHKDIIDATSK